MARQVDELHSRLSETMVRSFQRPPVLLSVRNWTSFFRIAGKMRRRNQAEMAHTCRGTINLLMATVERHGSRDFVVSNTSSGGTQTYFLRASSDVDAERWIGALKAEKHKAKTVSQKSQGQSTV